MDQEVILLISSSEEVYSPYLEIMTRRFTLPDHKEDSTDSPWGITLRHCPSENAICRWMEEQIATEPATSFEAEMDRLLLSFVRQSQAGIETKWQASLSDMLRMRCMWKVWTCKQLFFRPDPKSQGTPFNARVSSIHNSLRSVAAQALSEYERKLLCGIDLFIFQKKDKDMEVETIVKWLLLWQMMLLYRQSLGGMAQEQPIPLEGKW